MMKERTMLMLEAVTEGYTEERKKLIDAVTDRLVMFGKPRRWSGSEGAEVEQERQYERMCLLITQSIGKDAKGMTVMEYYAAYNLAKEQAQGANKRALRR